MKSRLLVLVKSVAREGVLYFGYVVGATIIFGVFYVLTLAFFVSSEVFSRVVIYRGLFNNLDNVTFFGSIAIAGVLFCLTLWVVFRKTSRLTLRILRPIVFSALLVGSYIAGFSIAVIFLEQASSNSIFGKILDYEKRSLGSRALMLQTNMESRSTPVPSNVSGYVIDNSCQSVYYYGDRMDGADWQSFQVLNTIYAKDAYRAYIFGVPIKGADVKTFSVMENVTDSNTRVLSGYNIYQAYDERFLYGVRMNDESAKSSFTMDKHEGFLRGVFFPGVEELGHCHTHRRYDGQIIFRDVSKMGILIKDDQFTQFTPLSDEFDHEKVRIQENEDCSQATVSDEKVSHRYRIN